MVAEVDGWLHCVSSRGDKGLVPSSYVQMLQSAGEGPTPRAVRTLLLLGTSPHTSLQAYSGSLRSMHNKKIGEDINTKAQQLERSQDE